MNHIITKDYVIYLIKYFQQMQSWETEDKIDEIKRHIQKDTTNKITKYQEYLEKEIVLSIIDFCSTVKCLSENELFNGMLLGIEKLETLDKDELRKKL